MSVGHIAREFEANGIPTVAVFVRAFRHVAESMGLPRVLITPHPMGRSVGAPWDGSRHRTVVAAALSLLETSSSGGTVVDLDGPFRPNDLDGPFLPNVF